MRLDKLHERFEVPFTEDRTGLVPVLHLLHQAPLATPLYRLGGLPTDLVQVAYTIPRCITAGTLTMVQPHQWLPIRVQAYGEVVGAFSATVVVKDNEGVAGDEFITHPVMQRTNR